MSQYAAQMAFLSLNMVRLSWLHFSIADWFCFQLRFPFWRCCLYLLVVYFEDEISLLFGLLNSWVVVVPFLFAVKRFVELFLSCLYFWVATKSVPIVAVDRVWRLFRGHSTLLSREWRWSTPHRCYFVY